MELHISVSDLVTNAAKLENSEFEQLFQKLNLLRAQRTSPSLPKSETDLLVKINQGFSPESWSRLLFLDEKMEFSDITEVEAKESLQLADQLESYTIERIINLKKLAALRKITVEQLMADLEITPN